MDSFDAQTKERDRDRVSMKGTKRMRCQRERDGGREEETTKETESEEETDCSDSKAHLGQQMVFIMMIFHSLEAFLRPSRLRLSSPDGKLNLAKLQQQKKKKKK